MYESLTSHCSAAINDAGIRANDPAPGRKHHDSIAGLHGFSRKCIRRHIAMNRWRHMAKLAFCAAVAVLAVFEFAQAQADEMNGRRLTIGAFGTIGVDYQDNRDLEYRRAVNQPDNANGGRPDFSTDSLAGLQINAAWNHQLELVLQGVSQDTADHHWRPRLTRGFIRYVPDQSIANTTIMLRGGRIGDEFFPRADSSQIGYTFLTLRPPVEMFGQMPNQDFDGADVTLTRPFGAGLGRAKLFGGESSGAYMPSQGPTMDLAGSRIWGAQVEYSRGPWAALFGMSWFLQKHPPSLDALVAGLRQTGQPQAQSLAQEFATFGRRTSIMTAALTYDEAPWQGRLYLVRTGTGSAIGPALNIGAATLGYGIGKFTPYSLLSRAQNYSHIQSTGLPDSPQTAALNAGAYAAQTQSQTNQSTVAVGLRYDFAPKMDFKFQIDHVWTQGSELVFDSNVAPRYHPELTVFGLAFDFVY